MNELKSELIKMIIENKLLIVGLIIGFLHSSLFYYSNPGKKSLKGYIKFVLTFGKSNESKP